ncbi:hypothetical protein G9A89_016834 [Geosiphon pyriformis]|nr:hypothetical protein G9A89_016834 [Geosiphon pyriformis]
MHVSMHYQLLDCLPELRSELKIRRTLTTNQYLAEFFPEVEYLHLEFSFDLLLSHPKTMNSLIFEFSISNVHITPIEVWSPIFSTSNDHFWQLKFTSNIEDVPQTCSLSLHKSAKFWKDTTASPSILRETPVTIFIKNPFTGSYIWRSILSAKGLAGCEIGNGWGHQKIAEYKYFPNLISYGVIFGPIRCQHPGREFPQSLLDIWKMEFEKELADVELNVSGKKYFASSRILIDRSEYFKRMLTSSWSESKSEPLDDKPLDISSPQTGSSIVTPDETLCNSRKKFTIDVTDFHHETFVQMLGFFYTNQVVFSKETDSPRNSFETFCVADKYLAMGLREIAKLEILQNITCENASSILFKIGNKWPDLKEPVLKFFVTNISKIRKTAEFKEIMANPDKYPGSTSLLAELFVKLIQEPDDSDVAEIELSSL